MPRPQRKRTAPAHLREAVQSNAKTARASGQDSVPDLQAETDALDVIADRVLNRLISSGRLERQLISVDDSNDVVDVVPSVSLSDVAATSSTNHNAALGAGQGTISTGTENSETSFGAALLEAPPAAAQQECPTAGPMVIGCTSAHTSQSLQIIANTLFNASLADSTFTSYKKMLSTFSNFAHSLGISHPVFPVSVQVTAQFIAFLFDKNLSPSTIYSHVSAISFIHKSNSFPDPTSSFIIKKILKGVKKLRPSVDTRLPITSDILTRLVAAIQSAISIPFHQSLLKAMFLLAFHAFLRIGEITVRSGNSSSLTAKVLQVEDVVFQYSKASLAGMCLTITNYKHSNLQPKKFNIPLHALEYMCPVRSLHRYLTMAKHLTGPLFQFQDGSPVTHSFFTKSLKTVLHFTGLNPKYYSNHCFRIGAATSAVIRGVPESTIRNMGRWKSNAVQNYIRLDSA